MEWLEDIYSVHSRLNFVASTVSALPGYIRATLMDGRFICLHGAQVDQLTPMLWLGIQGALAQDNSGKTGDENRSILDVCEDRVG